MSANLCLKERGKAWGQGVKMEHRVFVGTLFGCVCMSACVHVSMCSPVHVQQGGRKLRMRSKANNFIGSLHNLAAIPGVIVFL